MKNRSGPKTAILKKTIPITTKNEKKTTAEHKIHAWTTPKPNQHVVRVEVIDDLLGIIDVAAWACSVAARNTMLIIAIMD